MLFLSGRHEPVLPLLAAAALEKFHEEGVLRIARGDDLSRLSTLEQRGEGFQAQFAIRIVGRVAIHAMLLEQGGDFCGEIHRIRRGAQWSGSEQRQNRSRMGETHGITP